MKKKILKIFLLIGVLCQLFMGCTKDVDFNQINDFEITPVIESSLVFLDEPANQFYNSGIEVITLQDSVLIDVFKDKFVQDHLVKTEFIFDISNSINRGMELRVDFISASNTQLHTFTISVDPSPTNIEQELTYVEVFEGNQLNNLKETTQLVFTLNLLPGIPITENSPGTIKLKSKGVFYLNIDDIL